MSDELPPLVASVVSVFDPAGFDAAKAKSAEVAT